MLMYHLSWLATYITLALLLLAYPKPCTTRLSSKHVTYRLYVAIIEHNIITQSIPRCPAARVLTIFRGRLRLVLQAVKTELQLLRGPVPSEPSLPALDQAKCLICRAGVGVDLRLRLAETEPADRYLPSELPHSTKKVTLRIPHSRRRLKTHDIQNHLDSAEAHAALRQARQLTIPFRPHPTVLRAARAHYCQSFRPPLMTSTQRKVSIRPFGSSTIALLHYSSIPLIPIRLLSRACNQ